MKEVTYDIKMRHEILMEILHNATDLDADNIKIENGGL